MASSPCLPAYLLALDWDDRGVLPCVNICCRFLRRGVFRERAAWWERQRMSRGADGDGGAPREAQWRRALHGRRPAARRQVAALRRQLRDVTASAPGAMQQPSPDSAAEAGCCTGSLSWRADGPQLFLCSYMEFRRSALQSLSAAWSWCAIQQCLELAWARACSTQAASHVSYH